MDEAPPSLVERGPVWEASYRGRVVHGPRLERDGRSRRAAGLARPRAPLPRSHRRGCTGGLDRRGDRCRGPARVRDPHPRPARGRRRRRARPRPRPRRARPGRARRARGPPHGRHRPWRSHAAGRPGPPSAPARRSRSGFAPRCASSPTPTPSSAGTFGRPCPPGSTAATRRPTTRSGTSNGHHRADPGSGGQVPT